jgi:hypothetical protein
MIFGCTELWEIHQDKNKTHEEEAKGNTRIKILAQRRTGK